MKFLVKRHTLAFHLALLLPARIAFIERARVGNNTTIYYTVRIGWF